MGIIRELPREVAERIAAGEVVERPASVVKELVENAIDAGASSIRIDVEDGGKRRIAVIDDGSGMDADDLGRSILRHATSKIAAEADLWAIRTMGFRGEALAAIGAVSRFSIESKPNRPDAVEGARIEVDGGRVCGPVVAGCAAGTKAQASDIFYNVPARLKFLRSAAVEYGHVSEVVMGLALAFPDIRFELSGDGKRRFVSRAGDLKERVAAVMGEDIRGQLAEVGEKGGIIAVSGWVADKGRAGGKDVHIFLNRRPVRDRLLMHAVSAAFGERLSRGEYPAAVLWIDVDPSEVDVNVHPAKREVRFSNGSAVHDFVMAAVRKVVQSNLLSTIAPDITRSGVESAMFRYEQSRLTDSDSSSGFKTLRRATPPWEAGEGSRRVSGGEGVSPSEVASKGGVAREQGFETCTRAGTLRVLGQLASTYIVCENADGMLVLIDQHAAHERLGFDALKQGYAAGKVPRQRLLLPERVELGVKGLAYVEENFGLLTRAGFEIEPFGGGTLLVKEVPAILGDVALSPLFEKLAAELEEIGGSNSVDEAAEKIFAVVACHRQVRGGDALSSEELAALVRDIERENVTHCPHGRPAIVKIEKSEIEKWFKRRG
ncbi:MAG: DNA mismatch repair endonuclease MutL [Pseudomonadota bacterium]